MAKKRKANLRVTKNADSKEIPSVENGTFPLPVSDPSPSTRNNELAAALRGALNPMPILVITWLAEKQAWEIQV